MDLAEKIAVYRQLIEQIEMLDQQKQKISQEILAEMSDKKFETAEFKAIRYQRLSMRPSLELARQLDATKMEEQIDKEKIKQLFHAGIPIEGVEMRAYLVVSAKNQAKESQDPPTRTDH